MRSTADIMQKEFYRFNISPDIGSIVLKNRLFKNGTKDRISNLLAQVHAKKLAVSLNIRA